MHFFEIESLENLVSAGLIEIDSMTAHKKASFQKINNEKHLEEQDDNLLASQPLYENEQEESESEDPLLVEE